MPTPPQLVASSGESCSAQGVGVAGGADVATTPPAFCSTNANQLSVAVPLRVLLSHFGGRVAGKGGMEQSFMASSDEAAELAERGRTAGYDSHGGGSTLLNVVPTDHMGARRAPDTSTSGTVSGEAWESDPSQKSRPGPVGSDAARGSTNITGSSRASGTGAAGGASGAGLFSGSAMGAPSGSSGTDPAAPKQQQRPSARLSAHARPIVSANEQRRAAAEQGGRQ